MTETDIIGPLQDRLPPEEKQGKNTGHKWKPGECGNPKGRPKKGYSITEMMKQMMEEAPEKKRALGEAILAKALTGDIAAIKAIWNYMDGMPKQGVEVTGEDGGDIPVHIRVTYE